MLRQLEDHRFVAVVGSSGSGKSSLVRAGLLPAVREGFLLGATDWRALIIQPGHPPYERLVRRSLDGVDRAGEARAVVRRTTTALLRKKLQPSRRCGERISGFSPRSTNPRFRPSRRVMVVVDQFEELFAFRRAGVNRDDVASRDEAAAFVGCCCAPPADPAGRIWVVLTMRSDFIGDCEAFLGLPEQISRSQFLVPRLDRGQMEEAIRGPAKSRKAAFQTFTSRTDW